MEGTVHVPAVRAPTSTTIRGCRGVRKTHVPVDGSIGRIGTIGVFLEEPVVAGGSILEQHHSATPTTKHNRQ